MTHNSPERASAYIDIESQELLDALSQCDISEFLGESTPGKSEAVKLEGCIAQQKHICPQKLITQKELAAALSVSVQTVRSWKECPRVYVGKRADGKGSACRYDMAEVVAWLKDNRRAYHNAEKTWMQTSVDGKEVEA